MDILLSRLLELSSYDAGSGPGFCNELEVCYNCGSTTAITTRSEVTGKQVAATQGSLDLRSKLQPMATE